MSQSKAPRHSRAEIADKISPHRTVFAEMVFAHFDRVGWWDDVKLPWRRLSHMVTGSDLNVLRWFEGVMPKPEHIESLSDVLHIPATTIDYILRYNRWPDDDDALSSTKAKLCQVIPRLSDKQAAALLQVAEQFLQLGRDPG